MPKNGVHRRFAQLFPGHVALLFREVPFERDGLLEMERLKVTKFGVRFESKQRLGYSVDR